MWPLMLAAVVTSTTTATSSVADPIEDAPGAARVEVTSPPAEPPEPPGPPEPPPRARVEPERRVEPASGRVRTRELLARVVSQPNGFNADRAFGVELAAAIWFNERLGLEGRVAYAPLLYGASVGWRFGG